MEHGIDFSTVDGIQVRDLANSLRFSDPTRLQGQEKDIIILSCVRGGPEDVGIGFLSDVRRMNVALTRAKSSLFILGNKTALRQNGNWKALIEDAEARKCLLDTWLSSARCL